VANVDPIDQLCALLEQDKEKIVRQWTKRLRTELHEVDLPGRELRAPLEAHVTELQRLLESRGEDAVRLWPESLRAHGAARYDQRFEADDLARELKALHVVLLNTYGRRNGTIEPEVAGVLAELMAEAFASVQASFARALRTEEVRFREAAVMESILHHLDVGILLGEVDGALSYATPPVARLLGVPPRALVGGKAAQTLTHLLRPLGARHEDGTPFAVAEVPLIRALKEKQPVRGVWMVIDRHGEEVTLEMSAIPLWDDVNEGELRGVLMTLTDRTLTASKTRELSSAYDELRRLQGRLLQRTRTQALGQLASGAAHALNNYLNVIRLRVMLLRKELNPEHLDALDRTVGSVGELVTRLQEFSAHRSEDELADVDLDQTLREAIELVRPELSMGDEEPVVLEIELRAGARTRVDPTLLRELAVNLLLAAKDRSPAGGRLRVMTRTEGSWLHLRIDDTGKPYSEDDLARLFDPLKGKSRTPQLSLLLAVARNQVQRWGGELTCDNRSDGVAGASFEVKLPKALAETVSVPKAAARAQMTPLPRPASAMRRVLVVDDDFDNARMLAEVLSDEGYEVKVEHSGEAALKIWQHERFDAALLDALMPDMSGWELARELRKRTPHVLLAMVTGADVRGQNRNNLALVDAVFRKPIDVGALDDFLTRAELGFREDSSATLPP
jgi:signal transduction histidine kinase/CheY-like chemotaxis protein